MWMESVKDIIQANDTRVWFWKKTSENLLMIYLLNRAKTRNLWHSKIKSSLVFSWGKLPKCKARFGNLSNTVSITEIVSENSQPCSIKEVIFKFFGDKSSEWSSFFKGRYIEKHFHGLKTCIKRISSIKNIKKMYAISLEIVLSTTECQQWGLSRILIINFLIKYRIMNTIETYWLLSITMLVVFLNQWRLLNVLNRLKCILYQLTSQSQKNYTVDLDV